MVGVEPLLEDPPYRRTTASDIFRYHADDRVDPNEIIDATHDLVKRKPPQKR